MKFRYILAAVCLVSALFVMLDLTGCATDPSDCTQSWKTHGQTSQHDRYCATAAASAAWR